MIQRQRRRSVGKQAGWKVKRSRAEEKEIKGMNELKKRREKKREKEKAKARDLETEEGQ